MWTDWQQPRRSPIPSHAVPCRPIPSHAVPRVPSRTPHALKSLREEYTRSITAARTQAAQALHLERQLSDLVNEAYNLTPEEISLLWQTAPPRMPFTPSI